MRSRIFVFLVLASLGLGGPAAIGQDVTWFPVTPQDVFTPTRITAGSDGALWFTDLNGNNVGRLTRAGALSLFPVPHGTLGGTSGITTGPDGALWFTELFGARIGRLTTDGTLTEFGLSPELSYGREIVPGSDGALWFTLPFSNKIGRITTAGVITTYSVPTSDSFPAAIAAGRDGALWFTEATSIPNKIGRITTDGVFREFPLPSPDRYPAGIALGPDGNMWFTESWGKAIGRITLSGDVTEFPIGAEYSQPSGITAGPDGNLWFTDRAGSIGRISTAGEIHEFPLSHGADDYDNGITAGPDGALWFTWHNAIGRITTGACIMDPSRMCLNGGRFRIQADWRVPSQGSSGQGTGVAITNETGYFWFFSPGNVEMIVKVVDGCAFNERYWVFAGGLTNVEVKLEVTDTQTGEVRTYLNPSGTAFVPIQDTAAFASCRASVETRRENRRED